MFEDHNVTILLCQTSQTGTSPDQTHQTEQLQIRHRPNLDRQSGPKTLRLRPDPKNNLRFINTSPLRRRTCYIMAYATLEKKREELNPNPIALAHFRPYIIIM